VSPRYEVEVPEHDPDFAGAWRPVRVYRADALTTSLTFATFDEARAYVARAAGEARVVRVTDEGDREVVGPDET
jgi:hypothetical protein